MIKNIVIIRDRRFSERDYKRFGIDILLKNGFNVKIFDITEVVNPEIAKNHHVCDKVKYDFIEKITDKRTAEETFGNFSEETFVLLLLPFSFERYWIYNSISKSKSKVGVFLANDQISVSTLKKGYISYYFDMINNYSFHEIIKNLLVIFDKKFKISKGLMKPVDMVIVGGKNQISNISYKTDKNTKMCWTHTLDYDIYLKEKKESVMNEPIAVFLDQYLPYHPDHAYSKHAIKIDPDYYYAKLNEFFEKIERKLKVHVVIAAHPRSDYENKKVFAGREVIYGKTSQLIKKCKLVITHNSTALNFAVLYLKPIVFINFERLSNTRFSVFTEAFAKLLGEKAICIDKEKEINLKNEFSIN